MPGKYVDEVDIVVLLVRGHRDFDQRFEHSHVANYEKKYGNKKIILTDKTSLRFVREDFVEQLRK